MVEWLEPSFICSISIHHNYFFSFSKKTFNFFEKIFLQFRLQLRRCCDVSWFNQSEASILLVRKGKTSTTTGFPDWTILFSDWSDDFRLRIGWFYSNNEFYANDVSHNQWVISLQFTEFFTLRCEQLRENYSSWLIFRENFQKTPKIKKKWLQLAPVDYLSKICQSNIPTNRLLIIYDSSDELHESEHVRNIEFR